MKPLAEQCARSIEANGYQWTAFDLGGLGFGRSFRVLDESFHTLGSYETDFTERPTRALHKPEIVAAALGEFRETIVYVDVDTILRARIDEIVQDSYDVGVTVRMPTERKRDGLANAGVIFFNPTAACKEFVAKWRDETTRIGNDQAALLYLLPGDHCRIMGFPTLIYNWYYFPRVPPKSAKIVHFKVSALSDAAYKSALKSLETREN
jgi:hypothetical protein